MDDEFIKSMCIRDILRIDYSVTFPLEWGTTYESIVFPKGYEKPPKAEFEAKLQERLDAQPLKDLRKQRDTLLAKTDKYANTDWPHASLAKQTEWIEYRQALRNLPSVTEDPVNPVWPVRPDEVVAVVVKEETSNVVVEEETSNVVVKEETSNVVAVPTA